MGLFLMVPMEIEPRPLSVWSMLISLKVIFIFLNPPLELPSCINFGKIRYLQRDLAKMVEDDPPAIVLLFEPKGRPDDKDNDFYIQSKRNICVSCGEEKHYIRYRIIPSCYRMHFPEHLKSHRSHDIVLLCVDCHEKAHTAAERYYSEHLSSKMEVMCRRWN